MVRTSRRIHSNIQRQIDGFTDLIPVDLHALWDKSDAQFVRSRMVGSNVMANPTYWYSPSSRHQIGFWTFNDSDRLPRGEAVQETTLLSLLDDVTAELATRLIAILNDNKLHIGFTVNLNTARTGVSSSARLFYFDARSIELTGRKAIVECPLYDAESGKQLMIARATFVFIPSNEIAAKIKSMGSKEQNDTRDPLSPLFDTPDTQVLDESDLHDLSQVMNILPHGLVSHKTGSFSADKQRVAVLVDFNDNLNGPPNHVHGGILATVMCNVSELLFSKTTGISKHLSLASVRDIDYRKGVPTESKDVAVEAIVKDMSATKVIIVAKLTHGPKTYATLTTMFTIPVIASKL
ncbi:hypothetical protein LPJ59_003196 [Coemansia sp. RSA 2399]|nr:hypothetical protein LPJ59_003196 [Coemansia sp. RSA 2399]KAJ1903840.1 hypothetical protein LPJ81_002845 [Coemansia sp. IMI 209127]